MAVARLWLQGRPDAASLIFGLPFVEVRASGEGRGLGLFATRDVPAFTKLLVDPHMILMKPTDDLPQLYEQYQKLSKEGRDVYLSLSYNKEDHNRDVMVKDKLLKRGLKEGLSEMVNVASIMQTNAFNVSRSQVFTGFMPQSPLPNIILELVSGSCHRSCLLECANSSTRSISTTAKGHHIVHFSQKLQESIIHALQMLMCASIVHRSLVPEVIWWFTPSLLCGLGMKCSSLTSTSCCRSRRDRLKA